MEKIVFTFGTLYKPEITKALLGRVPQNFYAKLNGFSVYMAGKEALSDAIKEELGSGGRNLDTFRFLFAKKSLDSKSLIQGKAYYITEEDERILDAWEGYPEWYQKKEVNIIDHNGDHYKAFVYTQDIEGIRLKKYKRDLNDTSLTIENAKKLREKIVKVNSTN